ncbi:MAG: MFS transporter [Oscillospiraceae bacterium]|nr:MFS transporter [Oscillospiraceae bacterium]
MENENKNSLLNIPAFWMKQRQDWRITVYRTSMERLAYKMILPYLSLFIILLGATKTQYGYITSAGLIVGGIMGPFIGQSIDRFGPKKVYLVGIYILIGGYLAFSCAKVWQVAALGLFMHSVGGGISGQCCGNICGNCLENCDRAKGMLICESLAAGLLGMVGPMISGWILVNLMGVVGKPTDPNQIRPLFYVCTVIAILSLIMIYTKMSFASVGSSHSKKKTNVIKDGIKILKADKNCRKWVIIGAIGGMPMSLVTPYVSLFATEAKGASAGTLALMTSATALTSVLLGYAFGIISDKFGRKPILFVTIGLYIAGISLLLITKNPTMLILVGILQGFQEIGATLSASIGQEIITDELRGRFMGITRLTTAFCSAILAALSGNIWDKIGPQWVFIIYIVCEICIRVPLLMSMPDTLHYEIDRAKFDAIDAELEG